jgi:hypothetical protein
MFQASTLGNIWPEFRGNPSAIRKARLCEPLSLAPKTFRVVAFFFVLLLPEPDILVQTVQL